MRKLMFLLLLSLSVIVEAKPPVPKLKKATGAQTQRITQLYWKEVKSKAHKKLIEDWEKWKKKHKFKTIEDAVPFDIKETALWPQKN